MGLLKYRLIIAIKWETSITDERAVAITLNMIGKTEGLIDFLINTTF